MQEKSSFWASGAWSREWSAHTPDLEGKLCRELLQIGLKDYITLYGAQV